VAIAWPLARRLLLPFGVRVLVLLALILAAGLAFAQAAQPAAPNDCIVLDDFSKSRVGEFPVGWKPRKDEGKSVYRVAEEDGRYFLRALSQGLGIQAAHETEGWNLSTHPVLAWSWRPREFPKGADERKSATNDSALAVYMAVPHSKIRGPKAVKYIWSEKNALRDWRAFFKESDTPKPAGIAVLTDADDTNSIAAGDYANFRACRS